MTQPHIDLSPLVAGRGRYWGPAFIMSVVSHHTIFDILRRYVGPEGTVEGDPTRRKLAPAEHFARTVTPFVVGYTRRRNSDYARPLREAHKRNGVSPELIGRSVGWQLTIMCADAPPAGLRGLVDAAITAAPTLAQDFGGDPLFAVPDLNGLHNTFRPFTVRPEMSGTFWSVLDAETIRGALGIPDSDTDDDILSGIRSADFLPAELVRQYRR